MANWQEQIMPLVERALPSAEYEILDIIPKGSQIIHRLAGPEGMVAPLASQFLALEKVITGGIDLDEIGDKFELCFPEISNFSSPDFNDKSRPWGRSYENRPRFYIRDKDEKSGFFICEFYPNGRDGKSIMLYGRPHEIISHLFLLMAIGVQASSTNNDDFDLENFIDDFQLCFPNIGTFLDPDFSDKARPWGMALEDRPRIYIRQKSASGHYLCEFFPEGKDDQGQILYGRAENILQQIFTIMAVRRQLARYDIGAIIGAPINDYLRHWPSQSRLSLVFRLKTKPENYRDPVLYKTIRVPFIQASKIDYLRLWTACGGTQGLDWGPIACRAKIGKGENINQLHEVVAHGPSEEVAKQNVDRFLEFTELEVKRYTFNRSDWKNVADTSLNDTYKVYPCSVSVINSRLSQLDRKGQLTSGGYKKSIKSRILLKKETPPPNFEAIKANLLQFSNSDPGSQAGGN